MEILRILRAAKMFRAPDWDLSDHGVFVSMLESGTIYFE
jgi:hypothetical protein